MQTIKARTRLLYVWVQETSLYKTATRYQNADGNLLAAGMSYRAIFAVFAAAWIGFSLTGLWLPSNEQLWHALLAVIEQGAPGLIGEDGVISEEALVSLGGSLGWTSIVAGVGLVATAITWLGATRQAIRAMFSLGPTRTSVIFLRVVDLGLAIAFGVVLLLAAILTVVSTGLLTSALELFGFSQNSFWVQAAIRASGFVVGAGISMVALAVMFRVLSRLAIPTRQLWLGALGGSVALSILSAASGLVLQGASRNPLVASFAVFLGLLIWFNLVSRVILISAASIAQALDRREIDPRRISSRERELDDEHELAEAAVLLAQDELESLQREAKNANPLRHLLLRRKLKHARARLQEEQERLRELNIEIANLPRFPRRRRTQPTPGKAKQEP